ncbi:oxidoreductase [Acidothermaceae bacterium B102]|nr:oxidoreductase [Acidothermaceae bacterium B102]
MTPHVAVLGTGANGAGIGADLVRAGHDVTFIEQWPDHVEAMRRGGLRVEMPDRTTQTDVRALHLCEVATLREKFDLVFLMVKAYDSRWATELIKPYVTDDGLVIGLQNGMTLATVSDVMGPDRAAGGVIEVSAAMFTPGVVERHTVPEGSWFALGGLTPHSQQKATDAAALLRAAGTVEVVPDITSAKWMKLVVNCAELVTAAIVDRPMFAAARLPGMSEFMRAAGREALAAGVSLGYRPMPILGLTESDAADADRLVDALIDAVYTHFALPTTRTTVHQDWLKGRHSEVDEINGLVVRAHAAVGGSCPANEAIVALAHQIEDGSLKASPDNIGLLVSAVSS